MSFPFLEPFLRKYFIYYSKRYGIWYCKGLLSFINVFSGDIVTLHWVNQNLQLREQNIYSLYFWKLYLGSLCYPLLIPDEGQPKLSTSLYYQVRGPFFPGSSSLPSYIPVLGVPAWIWAMLWFQHAWYRMCMRVLSQGQVCRSVLFSTSEYSDHCSRAGGSVCMLSCLPCDFHE